MPEYSAEFPDSNIFVYDWALQDKRYPLLSDGIEILQVQDAHPEVKRSRCPVVLSDIPAAVEPLKRYLLAYEVTGKEPGGLGYWEPELVPYFNELDAINGRSSCSRGYFSAYAMISPLYVDQRTGDMILMHARHGYLNDGFCSMPVSGGNAPVTVSGAAIIGVSEILGGALLLDAVRTVNHLPPEVLIGGSIVSGSQDMRTMQSAFASPEAIQQDNLVHQFFREYCQAEVSFVPDYTDAKVPGMQCMFERLMKSLLCYQQNGVFNSCVGQLMSGALFSDVQAMIDIEYGHGLRSALAPVEITGLDADLEEISQAILASEIPNFLTSDRTLAAYRGNWYSWAIDHKSWGREQYYEKERALLEGAHRRWKEMQIHYTGPKTDPLKIAAMQAVLSSATAAMVH
jgi:trimethylamine:corrinoid methyltransferase-like protein